MNTFIVLACAEIKASRLDTVMVKGYSFYGSAFCKQSHKTGEVGIFINNEFSKDLSVQFIDIQALLSFVIS